MTIKEPVYPAGWANFMASFLMLDGLFTLVCSPIALTAGWGHTDEVIFGLCVTAVVWAPILALRAYFHNKKIQAKNGFVILDDGEIRVTGKDGFPPEYVASLAECRWFYGGRSWATIPLQELHFQVHLSLMPVLLVEFPASFRIPKRPYGRGEISEQPVIVEVGKTHDTRQEWERALYVHGATEDEEKRRIFSPISLGGGLLLGIISVVGGIYLAFYLADIAGEWVTRLGFAEQVAKSARMAFIAPGSVFLITMSAFLGMWWNRKCGVKLVDEELRSAGGITFIAFTLLSLGLACAFIYDSGHPVKEMLPCFIAYLTPCFLLGLLTFGAYALAVGWGENPKNDRDDEKRDNKEF